MDLQKYLNMVEENIVTPMLEFMGDDGEVGFEREHVERCAELLRAYLRGLDALAEVTDEAIMGLVHMVVLALNDLNEECDYSLIETEEREALWEIIQSSAVERGLKNADDDITSEWRDW